jgi:hypothetical protein
MLIVRRHETWYLAGGAPRASTSLVRVKVARILLLNLAVVGAGHPGEQANKLGRV